MDNLRQLLVAIAALTLLFSAVSGANPNYFAGYSAFADEDDEEDDDYSGSSEEEDSDDSSSEHSVQASFGAVSNVSLEIDDAVEDDAGSVEAELEIETHDGDLADGEHAVSLNCDTPSLSMPFDDPLVVEEGNGEFKGELLLINGTSYDGCEVSIGDMTVALAAFTVIAGTDEDEEKDRGKEARGEDDDEEDEAEDEDDDEEKGRGHEREAEDGGADLKAKAEVNMTDGTYDAQFTCEDPVVDMTIPGAIEVENGEAEFEAEVELADGTYNGCKVMSGDTTIASFDTLTVAADEEDDYSVEEKRKEHRRDIVSSFNAEEEHKRRVNANPASTGDYEPNWNYTLTAVGIGISHGEDDELALTNSSDTTSNSSSLEELDEQVVDLAIDMSVWKSNRAIVLLNIINGTVNVGGESYSVELGYALYSVSHDAMRLGAFVSDEDGNIYKLKLRGSAAEDSGFPMASGESVDLTFEGNSGPARNSFEHMWLELDGTVAAE